MGQAIPAGPSGPWLSVSKELAQNGFCPHFTHLCLGSRRARALQEGLRQAVAVPLKLAETVSQLWPALQELARCGNLSCLSDLQV